MNFKVLFFFEIYSSCSGFIKSNSKLALSSSLPSHQTRPNAANSSLEVNPISDSRPSLTSCSSLTMDLNGLVLSKHYRLFHLFFQALVLMNISPISSMDTMSVLYFSETHELLIILPVWTA
jgi:hypothetical protein